MHASEFKLNIHVDLQFYKSRELMPLKVRDNFIVNLRYRTVTMFPFHGNAQSTKLYHFRMVSLLESRLANLSHSLEGIRTFCGGAPLLEASLGLWWLLVSLVTESDGLILHFAAFTQQCHVIRPAITSRAARRRIKGISHFFFESFG